jgi:hypothetical protein
MSAKIYRIRVFRSLSGAELFTTSLLRRSRVKKTPTSMAPIPTISQPLIFSLKNIMPISRENAGVRKIKTFSLENTFIGLRLPISAIRSFRRMATPARTIDASAVRRAPNRSGEVPPASPTFRSGKHSAQSRATHIIFNTSERVIARYISCAVSSWRYGWR